MWYDELGAGRRRSSCGEADLGRSTLAGQEEAALPAFGRCRLSN